MNEQQLIDGLAASCDGHLPNRAEVLALRPFTRDDAAARARRFLNLIREADACPHDRANFVVHDDRTLVQLPAGARAVVYHASGALQFHSGLAPFATPFARVEEREALTRQVEAAAERLRVREWAGEHTLAFERLFQSKGQGADPNGRVAEALLFRAIGAYRQSIAGIPVLGAASVAVTLAGDGVLDALAVRIRPGVAETLDTAAIIAPELAARQVARNLASVLGKAKERLPAEAIVSQTLRFGYLDLGKRKAQRVLAPVFLARWCCAIARKPVAMCSRCQPPSSPTWTCRCSAPRPASPVRAQTPASTARTDPAPTGRPRCALAGVPARTRRRTCYSPVHTVP
ncbi:hypothetical protein [Massilia sp. Se16.2.3]|uniref:hypothetical protein n=1 Tax=Massilia sp. Se16.2.3 TaxID=2709303 RepID=UPI0016032C83|nr:hypothetical protein [Massilia sp. Se16.2.3]QNA99031.1 hypothetical protein G4G31_09525 [Massilia sp. Se16.2.3]